MGKPAGMAGETKTWDVLVPGVYQVNGHRMEGGTKPPEGMYTYGMLIVMSASASIVVQIYITRDCPIGQSGIATRICADGKFNIWRWCKPL